MFYYIMVIQITAYVHIFRPKIQALFKDFPGPYFKNSRTSQNKEHENMYRVQTCTLHLWLNVNACKSNKTGLGWKNKQCLCISISNSQDVCNLLICMNIWSYHPKTWYSKILLTKKIKNVQGPNQISTTFKVLKLDSWNSRVFKMPEHIIL